MMGIGRRSGGCWEVYRLENIYEEPGMECGFRRDKLGMMACSLALCRTLRGVLRIA